MPAFRGLVWEKRPEDLALIGTTADNFFGDFPENALAVVTGVAARLNLADFSQLLESTARTHYRLSSRANPPPLFKIDGFMTDTYKNAPRPKRQNPNDIHPF